MIRRLMSNWEVGIDEETSVVYRTKQWINGAGTRHGEDYLRRFRTFALASTISESQIEQAQIVRHWIIQISWTQMEN